jgi:hypothetical protein
MTEAEVELVERALFQLDEARQELARQRMELEECITGLQDIQALLTRLLPPGTRVARLFR